jgi:hypothetical protein
MGAFGEASIQDVARWVIPLPHHRPRQAKQVAPGHAAWGVVRAARDSNPNHQIRSRRGPVPPHPF